MLLVLSAPCPGAMGSPHGPRRWRRPPCPSRSTSRARPGTRARRGPRPLFDFVRTVLRHFTILHAGATHGTVSGLHDTARSQEPRSPIRTIIKIIYWTNIVSRPGPRHDARSLCKVQRRRRGPRANDVTKVESKESRRTAHKTMNRTNIAISRGSSPTPDPWNDATMLRRLHP